MVKRVFYSLFVLLLLATAGAGYFYFKWYTLKNNPVTITEDESKALIKKVGKLILLPDEQPTIATVTDPSKLSDQTFFTNAKVGYKVLVYSLAKKAILYDPEQDLIIEVGPVNVTDETSGEGGTTISNGSETPEESQE